MGTNNMTSIDPDETVMPIRTSNIPSNCCDHADNLRNRKDVLFDQLDHAMFQNSLADAIWKRCGKEDEVLSTEEGD